MSSKKWRTIADGEVRSHRSQAAAYAWVESQPEDASIRVEINEGSGRWDWYETTHGHAQSDDTDGM